MTAHIINAANKINADTAGLTGVSHAATVAEGAPSMPTVSEVVSHAYPSVHGELHYLFGEGLPQAVGAPLEQATHSTAGRLGGLVPTGILTGVQPGPRAAQFGQTVRTDATSLVSRVRKALGV